MEKTRSFKCADCGHVWEAPHGTGESGRDMECPECGSAGIHRYIQGAGKGTGGPHEAGGGYGFGHGGGRRKA